MEQLTTMSSYIQYGFAGFAFLLLALVFWMIRRLLRVLEDTNKVVANNTQVSVAVQETARETRELLIDIKDQLLSRPCLMTTAEQRAKVEQCERE